LYCIYLEEAGKITVPAGPFDHAARVRNEITMSRDRRPSPRSKDAVERIVRLLVDLYPSPQCALEHRNAFELLVATILSAQCTDVRVNLVTPGLFSRYPDASSLASADLADVEALIHSTGFFRAKARNLVAMASRLVEMHRGEVPDEFGALTKLPGVGRKTANVVMGNAFQIASGVVVDTHVKRLSFRLGMTSSTDPEEIEAELAILVPRSEWISFSHRLIEHGRKVCDARKPTCDSCSLRELCPRLGLKPIASV
jgi:endonuclease-3